MISDSSSKKLIGAWNVSLKLAPMNYNGACDCLRRCFCSGEGGKRRWRFAGGVCIPLFRAFSSGLLIDEAGRVTVGML